MTPRFLTLFWRQILRRSWRHPFLSGLNILSVALGITVFLAIQIANRGALSSFRQASELATGKAELEIRGTSLSDELLPAVADDPGVRSATPMVEGIVTLPGQPGEYLRILGIDPFTGAEIFPFELSSAGSALDLDRWLSDPDAIAVQGGVPPKGPVSVLAGTARRTLKPAFRFETGGPIAAGDHRLAVMDIGWAQELLGMAGRLSSIQILLREPRDIEAVAARLRKIAPPDAVVAPPATRSREMESMLGAFQLNLTALSLVSIIVGMFLIFNSVGAAVIRRRTDIAILRSNGATRTEIRMLFLGEAAIEALLGAALALLLAPELARGIAQPVSLSVSSLYEILRIDNTALELWQAAEAFVLALLASIAAAWLPASEAANCDPARILHPGSEGLSVSPLRLRGIAPAMALLASAAAMSIAALHGGPKVLGFGAAGAVIAGFSLLVPWIAVGVAACFRGCGPLAKLSSDHLVRSLRRNTVTIAALSAAVAMAISVTVMIHSFRASVQRWIDHTLTADMYIAPAVNEVAGLQAFLPPGAAAWAASQPQVAGTATFRELPVRFRDEPASLAVIDGKARGDIAFVGPDPAASAERFLSGGTVALSESFATRFGLAGVREIRLQTPRGEAAFAVSGIYRDFSRDRGTILMPRSLFEKYWTDDRIHSLALKLREGGGAGAVAGNFRARYGSQGEYSVYDNAALRERVYQIFNQTFAVTAALRVIAIFVAVAGVLFALSVLVAEREREIGVLRAVGASRLQVLRVFLGEALIIGLAASLSGMVCGAVLAMVLTWVVNKAFFGWTIALSYPFLTLAATPLWLVPAALLAAFLPAWKAANVPPARAVRFE